MTLNIEMIKAQLHKKYAIWTPTLAKEYVRHLINEVERLQRLETDRIMAGDALLSNLDICTFIATLRAQQRITRPMHLLLMRNATFFAYKDLSPGKFMEEIRKPFDESYFRFGRGMGPERYQQLQRMLLMYEEA